MTQEQLKLRDWYLLLDRSGSMAEANSEKAPDGQTRWQAAEEMTVALAREGTKYDDDGISVILFNNQIRGFENVTGGIDLVKKLFAENGPNGGTDTTGALAHVLNDYWARKAANPAEVKPLAIFIATDGIPNNEQSLVDLIKATAEKVADEDEIRINFIQVGDNQHAHDFLVRLDTGLNAKFDIVNTKTMVDLENHPTLADGVLAMVSDLAEAAPVAQA
jgi:uncharacterized protein with von Willebrand factor type A (vWA) domain